MYKKNTFSFSLLALSSSFCYISTAGLAKDIELKDLNISANLPSKPITTKDKYKGSSSISKNTISSIAGPRRGLTDILKINPNVTFANTQVSSKNQGELDSQDISINGARSYQNNFIIDGMSINNDLNPSSSLRVSQEMGSMSSIGMSQTALPDIGSISQGINLDPDLIETLNVYDSSVSAKYGSFQGGVVETKTRNPRNGFHGKISSGYTSDKYTKIFVDEKEKNDFENSHNSLQQPKFKKIRNIVELEGYVAENLGILFNYSRSRSTIPLLAYSENYAEKYGQETKNQTRKNDNFFLKARYFATDNLTITPSFIYAPSSGAYHNPAAKNSKQTYNSGGLISSIDLDYDLGFGKLNQVIGFSNLNSSRDAEHEYYKLWSTGSRFNKFKTGGNSGGFGDIDQTQKTLSYKASLDFEKAKILDIGDLSLDHSFSMGLELKKVDASYKIKRAFNVYSVPSVYSGKTVNGFYGPEDRQERLDRCHPDDEACTVESLYDWDPSRLDGYAYMKKDTYSGETKAKIKQYSFWLQDELELGNLSLRPGVRFDKDSYTNKLNVAPRFVSSYEFSNSKITLGLNRYYGRSPLALMLKEGREDLKTSYKRKRFGGILYDPDDPSWEIDTSVLKKSDRFFRKLKTPYDDELAIGFDTSFYNLDLGLKYIHRKGKNLIFDADVITEGIDISKLDKNKYNKSDLRVFTNKGESKTDIYTVTLSNKIPYKIQNSTHAFELAFNYTDARSNSLAYNSFVQGSNTHKTDSSLGKTQKPSYKYLKLDGKIINIEDAPAEDFNRKWSLRLSTISKFPNFLSPKLDLTVGNTFRLEAPLKRLQLATDENVENYNGHYVTAYRTKKISGTGFNWDIRLGLVYNTSKNSEFFANLDVLNVLNKKIVSGEIDRYSKDISNVKIYQSGRSFYFEGGYRW
ncbi:TonB-dependent receptor [Campylobacter blaseri]|uniref:TonB-dependent receptor plug domain-containing protein n=1 Tax=Campylobacter blaseri TaxID=2042961 RepID=UPI0013001267|nr:TonB-dependent receptor plug domain-containing protein [Campylobacter blaseri]QKF86361.1 TonB-dependent receptor [Campylobacter blaseri]